MSDKPNDEVSGSLGGGLRGQIEETKGGKLKAPKNIVLNVEGARMLYFKYRSEHLARIDLYAQIEGLIAGNPPYDQEELEQLGLSHIANFNNLDARSLWKRGALAYWNLLNEAETIATFSLSTNYKNSDQGELIELSNILSKHFNDVVREWPSFYTQFATLSGQLIKFGVSPILWSDERDWRWRTIELSKFFVTDQAQSDVELLTAICVESPFTVQYLYEVYEEYSDKKESDNDSGWNIEALKRLLLSRANSYVKSQTEIIDMMDVQKHIQNGDILWDQFFTDTLRIVSLFYKEYDGKITHYMFDKYFDQTDFLYKADKQYNSMQEAVVIFTASPGEFTIHSNRGLGHEIFAGCQATMQTDCSIMDATRWGATPLIKTPASGSNSFDSIKVYPGVATNIGMAEFVQNTIGENISQLIGASQYMLSKMNYNTANSGEDPSMPDKSVGSVSDAQDRRRSYKEFGVTRNNIAHFYSQSDTVILTMVSRMLKSQKGYPGYEYAKEFKDRCLDDGVPPEIFQMPKESKRPLPKGMGVKATRVAGDGSTVGTLIGLETLAPFMSGLGARGQKQYMRQMVRATLGHNYIPVMLDPRDQAEELTGGASLAGVENAVMRAGESPVFSVDNDHRAHVSVHLALGNDTIQSLQQQQSDPVQADKIFNVLIPHTEEHMKALAQNPLSRSFFEGVKQAWNQLQQYAQFNRKNAGAMLKAQQRKQMEDQQATEQVMTDAQRKDFQAQSDERRKDIKVGSQVERAKEANINRADVGREKVIRDSQNQRLKIVLDSKNKSDNNASEQLKDMAGTTPSPYDFEKQT